MAVSTLTWMDEEVDTMLFRVVDDPLPPPRGGPQGSGVKYPALVEEVRRLLFDPHRSEVCFEFATEKQAMLAYWSLRNYVKAMSEELLPLSVSRRSSEPAKVWVTKGGARE